MAGLLWPQQRSANVIWCINQQELSPGWPLALAEIQPAPRVMERLLPMNFAAILVMA